MRALDLFTGVGGLALGLERAGFRSVAFVEWEREACETLKLNKAEGPKEAREWNILQVDARQLDYREFGEDLDLLSAGPPCQPFSIAGRGRGYQDERDMFPVVFRAVRQLKPKFVLIENVRGLCSKRFMNYFNYIILQLTYPEITKAKGTDWFEHLKRLENHHTRGGKFHGLSYRVVFRVLNAADYGVPQKRERLFIVGVREDLGIEWSFPSPTHSLDALIWDQEVEGRYWERHKIPPRPITEIDHFAARRAQKVCSMLIPPATRPWVTVRDSLSDLEEWNGPANAKPYPGHTGSDPDMPAKTLKAGVHGVPGGENCVRLPGGGLRYFSVREMARLQTFPDDFLFTGSWSVCARHLGNAVPVKLAEVLGRSIYNSLLQVPKIQAIHARG